MTTAAAEKGSHAKAGYRDIVMRVLGDGEWHTFQQLFYALESRIDPQIASKAASRLKQAPDDLDERLRYGKEMTVSDALSGLKTEQQGFRSDRSTRKYRLRPDAQSDMEYILANARVALRAIMAVPGMRECFRNVLDGKTDPRLDLNPAQRYWLEFALSPEADADAALPFEDGEDPTP